MIAAMGIHWPYSLISACCTVVILRCNQGGAVTPLCVRWLVAVHAAAARVTTAVTGSLSSLSPPAFVAET